jgi:nitrilase
MADPGALIGPISGGSFTAIVSPLGELLGEPLLQRKAKMDASGHYSRPELLSPLVDRSETAHMHEQAETQASAIDAEVDRVRI